MNALIDCQNLGTASGCSFLGDGIFPDTVMSPRTISYPYFGPFAIGGINQLGLATATGTISFTLAGLTAVIHLVGQEVSRTFVPEPGTGMLLGLGLVFVGVVAERRNRRIRLHRRA